MVDGMGCEGCEGIFRSVMEVVCGVLRENQETLCAVLEPFLQDPTVGWDRSGRAQKDDPANQKHRGTTSLELDPKRVLSTVRGRLRGVYNLRDSHAWGSKPASQRPAAPLGLPDSSLEFSVAGQVERLIAEATSDENLAQMYVGWMPWY
jgi:phosphatidylinositol kinase/protein kinase (PI-3  family)